MTGAALPRHGAGTGKIARELDAHRGVLVAVACVSMVYAVAFLVYLWRLHDTFRQREAPGTRLSTLVLVGGVLFLTLHAVSDTGITGMLGGKVAAYSAQRNPGLSYTLYLTTFAVDIVGDVLGSVFAVAVGVLVLSTGAVAQVGRGPLPECCSSCRASGWAA